MGEHRIETLKPSDFELWLPLWNGYLEFYRTEMSVGEARASFFRITAGGDGMGGFVARLGNGEAAGITHWLVHPSTWTERDYCYLQDLYVSERARGLGIGRALIDNVYALARERNLSRVYWLTHGDNSEARLLYDQIAEVTGFVQYRKMITG